MILLLACTGANTAPLTTHCPGWDDVVVTDPEGAASEDDFDAVDATLAAFRGWVEDEDVCVGEVRLETSPESRGVEVGGYYRDDEQLVVVGLDTQIEWTLTHELCHALDDVEWFSDTYADLLADVGIPDSDLYDSESSKRLERFAYACMYGPEPRAVSEAAEAACGDVDPWSVVMRDEVFPGYTEAVPIGIGGAVTRAPLDVTPLSAEFIEASVQTGESVAVLYGLDTATLGVFDLDALAWRAPVDVPGEPGTWWALLDTLPDAAPVVEARSPEGGLTLAELRDGALVDPGLDWVADRLAENAVLTLTGDRAVWQVFGDGEPLQWRLRDGGDAEPVPGDDDLVLWPDAVRLPEGDLVWNISALPPTSEAYTLDADGVRPAAVPVGVSPRITLPDGRVLATARWDAVGTWRWGWVVRDTDGAWTFSTSSCDADVGSWYEAGGGRVVVETFTGDAMGWDELTVE